MFELLKRTGRAGYGALGRAATRMAAAALTLGATAIATPPALAQGGGTNVFVAVDRDDNDRELVVFVFGQPGEAWAPIDAMVIFINPERDPEADLDPQVDCGYSLDWPTDIDEKFREAPIYGADWPEGRTLHAADLPTYFASEAAKLLVAEGFFETEQETFTHFSCTGFVWSLQLSQPPEFWEKLIEEARQRHSGGGEEGSNETEGGAE